LNYGDGTFTAAVRHIGAPSQANLAIGDLNGDGKTDIVYSTGGMIGVLLNRGDGTLGAPSTFPVNTNPPPNSPPTAFSVAVADLNHDGKPDIVATFTDGVAVLLNTSH